MMHTPPDFTRSLRQATHAQHDALEALPFSRMLLAKQLPLAAYQAQLLAYWPLLQHLEHRCATADNPAVRHVWRDNLRRSQYLAEDLAFFQLPPATANCPPVTAFIADLDACAAHRPVALLGCLYVFEGSMLGSRVLLPLLRETYQLQGSAGCRYYAACETYPPDHWKHFKHRLEEAAQRGEDHENAIIYGAQIGFQHVAAILAPLAG